MLLYISNLYLLAMKLALAYCNLAVRAVTTYCFNYGLEFFQGVNRTLSVVLNCCDIYHFPILLDSEKRSEKKQDNSEIG